MVLPFAPVSRHTNTKGISAEEEVKKIYWNVNYCNNFKDYGMEFESSFQLNAVRSEDVPLAIATHKLGKAAND